MLIEVTRISWRAVSERVHANRGEISTSREGEVKKRLPVLRDFPQRVRAPYQLVQSLRKIGKGRTMSSFLLPAIEHQLIDGLRAVHRRWKPVPFLDRLYHILIRPVPIRPLTVGHHLPTNDAHTPYVGSAGELSERYRFRSCPSYRDLSTLFAGVNSLSRFDI